MKRESIPLYSCGALIFTTYFGEQIKIISIPLYCYIIIVTIISIIVNGDKKNRILLINTNNIAHFSLLWVINASFLFLFTVNKVGTQPYLYCLVSALIIYAVSSVCKDHSSLEYLYKCAYAGLIVTCVACTIELRTGVHYISTSDYYFRMGLRNTFGFQVNVNDNATLLAASIYLPLRYVKRKPLLNICMLAWILYLILRIDSRLAILSVGAAGAIALITYLTGFLSRKGNYMLGTIATMLGIVFVFFLVAFFNEQRFLGIISDSANYENDAARLLFMRSAIEKTDLIGFLLGNGAGVTQYRVGYSLHCLIVEVLCDYGIVIAIWLVAFILKMISSFTSDRSISTKMYTVSFGVCFLLLSFCSSSILRIRSVWVIFTIVWCNYCLNCGEKNEEKCE